MSIMSKMIRTRMKMSSNMPMKKFSLVKKSIVVPENASGRMIMDTAVVYVNIRSTRVVSKATRTRRLVDIVIPMKSLRARRMGTLIFVRPFLSSLIQDLGDVIMGLSLAQPTKINLPLIQGLMILPVVGPYFTVTDRVPVHGLGDPQVSVSFT